jgi:lysyl-tRNA synthetase class 2
MSTQHLSEQQIIRREKLEQLKKLNIDAYPAALYPVNTTSIYIKENYKGEENKDQFADVCIAGRIMSVRDMGKANFAVLQDGAGKIQLYIKQDDICPGEDKTMFQVVWKKLLDIGDIIGIKGYVFTTKTGETSIHVKEFSILTKSLSPLPVVKQKDGESFDEVTDPEFRYRQRYADLIVNPGVKETFIKRTKMINSIREFLNEHGALEVDTPYCNLFPAEPQRGLLLPTTMRWICRCTCVSPMSFI